MQHPGAGLGLTSGHCSEGCLMAPLNQYQAATLQAMWGLLHWRCRGKDGMGFRPDVPKPGVKTLERVWDQVASLNPERSLGASHSSSRQ